MKKLIFIIPFLFYISCQESIQITDSYTLGESTFYLTQKGSEALLTVEPASVGIQGNLQVSPPCYFIRENGKIQSFSYSDVEVEEVLIIVGNIAEEEEKAAYGVEAYQICGTQIQGLLVKKDKIVLTEETISGAMSCKDMGLDEKDFWDFAH